MMTQGLEMLKYGTKSQSTPVPSLVSNSFDSHSVTGTFLLFAAQKGWVVPRKLKQYLEAKHLKVAGFEPDAESVALASPVFMSQA